MYRCNKELGESRVSEKTKGKKKGKKNYKNK